MKRNHFIVVFLAILVPGALLAQDELSLECLAERVKEMSSDFGLFGRGLARVNSRVDAIEEQLASYLSESGCLAQLVPVQCN